MIQIAKRGSSEGNYYTATHDSVSLHSMTNARDVDLSASPDERRSLLSNSDVVSDAAHTEFKEQPTPHALSSKKRNWRFAGSSILLSLIFVTTVFGLWPHTRYGARSGRDALYSNGTHEFKKTVLMISIDGFRADYLDRGFTPHLLDISQKGVRAEHMKPVFPVRSLFRYLTWYSDRSCYSQ